MKKKERLLVLSIGYWTVPVTWNESSKDRKRVKDEKK